ncbi:GNAT family N-acetyltransferase [Chryseobacterium camelliae]|uniref:GNAT family N-acetyltransferase n=1 Tax=Chryseobacterium camelliae TaxID=1265445 RepID=A0ABY7QL71_9FLAO|nr:GNAT family N-acetyltransferase [Chryseobacterium camelliae]WBV59796.1 GNAT family N-acetyltransferase [Chryseobacterium camelliae]
MTIKRTDSSNSDFQHLVQFLDQDLAIRDGDEHSFYHQFNSIDLLKNCVLFYVNEKPVACGAFKKFDEETVEIKRMFVQPEYRGNGYASKILNELELWAKSEGYKFGVLETGLKQPEAIALYKKNGYHLIPNYGQYIGVENSVCYKKEL